LRICNLFVISEPETEARDPDTNSVAWYTAAWTRFEIFTDFHQFAEEKSDAPGFLKYVDKGFTGSSTGTDHNQLR
jgi:hypothetical protein